MSLNKQKFKLNLRVVENSFSSCSFIITPPNDSLTFLLFS